MRIYEIISEHKHPAVITVRQAKQILTAMGFSFTGKQKGSHEMWKDKQGVKFPVPDHGKDLSHIVTRSLNHLMKERGFTFEDIEFI